MGSTNGKTAQKNLQKPRYRIEFYQNTETAVTNVNVVFTSIHVLEARHSITNLTLCIPITPYVARNKLFLLIWRDASRSSPPCSRIHFSFYKILLFHPSFLRKKLIHSWCLLLASSCSPEIVLQVDWITTRHWQDIRAEDPQSTYHSQDIYIDWSYLVLTAKDCMPCMPPDLHTRSTIKIRKTGFVQ